MFENKTETEARKEILDLVAEYADKFHNQKKEFHEGDRIPYAATMQGFFYQCPYKQGSRTQDNITLNRNFVLSLRR